MRKRVSLVLALTAALMVVAFLCACGGNNSDAESDADVLQEVTVTHDAQYYEDEPRMDVKEELADVGFTNISFESVKNTEGSEYDGKVKSVSIDGSSSFEAGDTFPSDAPVEISYYTNYDAVARAQKAEESASAAEAETESTTSSSSSKGLVVYQTPTSDTVVLELLNPTTGTTTSFRTFSFAPSNGNVYWMADGEYANHRGAFSGDFDKMAVTILRESDHERHAGWIDQNGNIVDVTEKLGQASEGDFSKKVSYSAIGFAQDGSFVFGENHEGSPYATMYHVDPNNLSAANVQEGNSFWGYGEGYEEGIIIPDSGLTEEGGLYDTEWWINYDATSWIDPTHCIADRERNSYILDIDTQDAVTYIPDSDRINWDGIIDPTGTQIAFLSAPEHGSGGISLYTVPKAGGDPVKVNSSVSFTSGYGDGTVTLLAWI